MLGNYRANQYYNHLQSTYMHTHIYIYIYISTKYSHHHPYYYHYYNYSSELIWIYTIWYYPGPPFFTGNICTSSAFLGECSLIFQACCVEQCQDLCEMKDLWGHPQSAEPVKAPTAPPKCADSHRCWLCALWALSIYLGQWDTKAAS